MAKGGGEAGLGGGRTHSPKRGADGDAEMPSQVGSLIESAFAPAGRMQRNRNRHVRAHDHLAATLVHQGGERPGQRPPAVVFQRVNDCA